MTNSILLVSILLFGFIFLGFILSLKKSTKTKFIVWGIMIILITPFLSWVIGIIFGIIEGDGFAAVAVIAVLFPLFFIIGLVILIIGIVKKDV
ncbi:hypothetical protein [Lysinibacillus piscis]|uniref:Uncharacterized protein n=1 Tax=Lysinibacillus piscis TaxID=2518931 RepID=A0ABQ5NPU1_9BACI|nr:hypothetical protein [Lysinibacillus sp. KH24]GLC90343.1 hypothetical protein LYSBPC_34700 [Lysinibacillus sp. KH24]